MLDGSPHTGRLRALELRVQGLGFSGLELEIPWNGGSSISAAASPLRHGDSLLNLQGCHSFCDTQSAKRHRARHGKAKALVWEC